MDWGFEGGEEFGKDVMGMVTRISRIKRINTDLNIKCRERQRITEKSRGNIEPQRAQRTQREAEGSKRQDDAFALALERPGV